MWKYRRLSDGTWQVTAYDPANDPQETRDVFDGKIARHQEMADRLRQYKARFVKSYDDLRSTRDGVQAVPHEDKVQKLRSLGYIE